MKNAVNNYYTALRAKSAELASSLRSRGEIAVQTSAESLEQMLLATQRDLAIETIDRKSQLLGEVTAALERLSDGTFGSCEECGCEIPEKRLRALPWARYCVRCQEATETIKPANTGFFRLAA